MNAGRFNRRIVLQQRSAGYDSLGQPLDTWSDVAPLWADIRMKNGLQSLKADAEVSINQASIRIRYRDGINAGMRVVQGSTVYEIEAVLPDVAGRKFVDLVCKVLP